MRTITWIVKLSKLCNLRCAYCYEWDHLADPRRMSDELLTQLFEAARDYHHVEMKRTQTMPVTQFIWHGGEPFAMPLEYLERVQDTLVRVLGPQSRNRRWFAQGVQTNLYKLNDGIIEYLRRHHISVGVSLDLSPGVRVSVTGRDTERQVLRNLDRLRDAGVEAGAITVVARHTIPRLREAYDFYAARGMTMRALPLFAGPATRPQDRFAATQDEIVEAMCSLFVHWIETGAAVTIFPLREYFENVVRNRLSLTRQLYDRREGERAILVDTDGTAYGHGGDYDPAHAIGKIGEAPFAQMLAADSYAASLAVDDSRRSAMCGPCPHKGGCDTYPAFEAPWPGEHSGRCPIASRIHSFMDAYLTREGYTAAELRAMLLQAASATEAPLELSA